MTITKEQIEAARKAAPVHLGPALDSTIVRIGEAMLGAQPAVAVPDGWENKIFEEMYRRFNLRRYDDDFMQYDDTQIGVEFAIEQFKAMLAAAPQPAPQPVAVKPLEWDHEAVKGFACSRVGVLSYTIMLSVNRVYSIPGEHDGAAQFATEAEAKAAAQADYERRILSALTAAPSDEWTKVVSRLTQERDEAREENERLKAELDRFRSERSYVIGCNDGYDAAEEQSTSLLEETERLRQRLNHYIKATTDKNSDLIAAEQRVKALEEALEPFATVSDAWLSDNGWRNAKAMNICVDVWFGAEDFRRARAALKGDA